MESVAAPELKILIKENQINYSRMPYKVRKKTFKFSEEKTTRIIYLDLSLCESDGFPVFEKDCPVTHRDDAALYRGPTSLPWSSDISKVNMIEISNIDLTKTYMIDKLNDFLVTIPKKIKTIKLTFENLYTVCNKKCEFGLHLPGHFVNVVLCFSSNDFIGMADMRGDTTSYDFYAMRYDPYFTSFFDRLPPALKTLHFYTRTHYTPVMKNLPPLIESIFLEGRHLDIDKIEIVPSLKYIFGKIGYEYCIPLWEN